MKTILFLLCMVLFLTVPVHGEMYKWVDEKGTVHFTDDPSRIPEKYQSHSEIRKAPKESFRPETKEESGPAAVSPATLKGLEPKGLEVPLFRRHELLLTEVLLNGKVKKNLVVDSGASFILISQKTATELGIAINDTTPFIPGATVSGFILTPLVTLESVRVGNAEVRNVEAVVYNMPSSDDGLLGNSFLNKFTVALDSLQGKMTLFSVQGEPSPDRPGGYKRDYWVGQFRFYHGNLESLMRLKATYENQGKLKELNRVHHAIRYFENQLSELERRASFAGVPRNWRE